MRVRAASSEQGHGDWDHFVVRADIGVEAEIAQMIEMVLARWPRLDCLVNMRVSRGSPNAQRSKRISRSGASDRLRIAALFAFLASDEASYITGQTIYACGGHAVRIP